MRFKGLDLNLLVVLDVLLTEKNVSQAADKLCLSQSATSGALARLRNYFQDDLLVQVGRKMVLTTRAQALADKVRHALIQIDGTIIQAPDFDPFTIKRTIRIVASDYVAIAGLSESVSIFAKEAPGLCIVLEPPTENPPQRLERGEVDFLIMPEGYLSPAHPSEKLFSDTYVVVMCGDNKKYGNEISKEEFYCASHVSVKFQTLTPLYESWFLKHQGIERDVGAITGSFSSVPFFLKGTDRIALLQSRLAQIFARQMPLRLVPSPIDIPALEERIQWNAFAEGDTCLQWVRSRIAKTLAEI